MNKHSRSRHTVTENSLTVARLRAGSGGGWRMGERSDGIKNYKWLLKNGNGDGWKAQHKEYSQ